MENQIHWTRSSVMQRDVRVMEFGWVEGDSPTDEGWYEPMEEVPSELFTWMADKIAGIGEWAPEMHPEFAPILSGIIGGVRDPQLVPYFTTDPQVVEVGVVVEECERELEWLSFRDLMAVQGVKFMPREDGHPWTEVETAVVERDAVMTSALDYDPFFFKMLSQGFAPGESRLWQNVVSAHVNCLLSAAVDTNQALGYLNLLDHQIQGLASKMLGGSGGGISMDMRLKMLSPWYSQAEKAIGI